MKGLDYAEKTYPFIDKDRECALGASYGGYMASTGSSATPTASSAWSRTTACSTPNPPGARPKKSGSTTGSSKALPTTTAPLYQKWSPHQYAKNFKTPTLVIHGQRDYRLDVSEGFQLFTTLQMQGVPSKMLYFPDEGHWVLKPQNSPALVQNRQRLGRPVDEEVNELWPSAPCRDGLIRPSAGRSVEACVRFSMTGLPSRSNLTDHPSCPVAANPR